ncbi:MAG: RDD family protein [Pyrinomonadaceae bacterium]
MMFDSVREELQTKITSGRLIPKPEVRQESTFEMHAPVIAAKPISVQTALRANAAVALSHPQTAPAVAAAPVVAPPPRRVETADLRVPKTSPTLVGFQSKNATLPDWRIQLQNAVQQRKGGAAVAVAAPEAPEAVTPAPAPILKAQAPITPQPAAVQPPISDPRVANALKRINESRDTFLEAPKKKPVTPPMAAPKPYKFDVVAGNPSPAIAPQARFEPTSKPQLVKAPAPLRRDTNKLPPIAVRPPVQSAPLPDVPPIVEEPVATQMPVEFAEIKRIRIRAENQEIENYEHPEVEGEDIEDLAHFSTRFGAGLFDLIIASFTSLLILSPVAFTRGDWFSGAGVLTFAGVSAIVMFLYMTISLGFYGKTMGMRLFSLELVDAIENEYPTLHQAAVSSSVFIISLLCVGAGFLTVFFNEEKRAAHDLLSGTILVREF